MWVINWIKSGMFRLNLRLRTRSLRKMTLLSIQETTIKWCMRWSKILIRKINAQGWKSKVSNIHESRLAETMLGEVMISKISWGRHRKRWQNTINEKWSESSSTIKFSRFENNIIILCIMILQSLGIREWKLWHLIKDGLRSLWMSCVTLRFPKYVETESRRESTTYIREEKSSHIHAKSKVTWTSYISKP